jgi:uridine kinase
VNSSGQNQCGVCVIAIVGGSGAGKTWLANRLMQQFADSAMRLSLDDYYLDRSHLPAKRREKLNFDRPQAIDWEALAETLTHCRQGQLTLTVPRYDFVTHSRSAERASLQLKPVVMIDGLWLFHRADLRALFDLKIFIECPDDLRFCRRMERDVLERGRTADSVTEQFRKTVLPMHERHVQPQARWADEVICSPLTDADVLRLSQRVKEKREMSSVKISLQPVNN